MRIRPGGGTQKNEGNFFRSTATARVIATSAAIPAKPLLQNLFTYPIMKNAAFLLFGLLLAASTLSAQNPALTPIVIKNNRFYQDGNRLKPNQELSSVLALARCGEVDDSLRKAKSLQTTGTVIMGVGVGLMAISLVSQAKGNSSAGLMLGGAVVELIGVGFLLPAAKHRKKAVNTYNDVARGGACGN